MPQVIETCAPERPVAEVEARWSDHVHRYPEARRHAQDGAGILRDVRLVEGEAHARVLQYRQPAAPGS